MKKNRISESEFLNASENTLCRSPVKDVPVFLVLGLCILAINIFPSPKTIFQNNFVTKNTVETFFWISGSTEMKEGLYSLSGKQLEQNFPELLSLIAKKSVLQETDSTVSAFTYNSGNPPRQITMPPVVANIFFLPIPINSAGKDILSGLPGIGPVLAEKIIQRREERGVFRSKKDLLDIAGIGPKKFARLVDHIILD